MYFKSIQHPSPSGNFFNQAALRVILPQSEWPALIATNTGEGVQKGESLLSVGGNGS